MRHLLIENAHPIITDFLADFCAFACEKLGLAACPPITFVEHTGNASFGSYSPSEGTIVVATSGRHAADILRTLAHEFVHEQQIKSGTEQTLIEMEYEANAIAGMLMRDYNQLHPGLYGVMDSVGVENDTDEHESFGATAADPTRPSGPIELAELSNKTLATYKRKAKSELRSVHRIDKDGMPFGYRIDYLHNRSKYENRRKGIKAAETKLQARYASLKEDAPVNAAGPGEIAGIGVGPQGEPGIKKSKMIRRKPKSGLATIFAGFPRKTLKEYKAHITNKLNWNEIMKDKNEPSPMGTLGLPHTNMRLYNAVEKRRKNLGFLGLPHKSLKQFLKGK